MWTLTVSKQTSHAETSKAQQLIATTKANLLEVDQPTPMVEWVLTSLYVPIAIYATPAAEIAAGSGIASATLVMRAGGDIVYAKTVELPFPKTAGAGLAQVGYTFADDFTNPIVFARGRTLTLELIVSLNFATNGFASALSASVKPESSENFEPGIGVINYYSRKLSGHRELA